MHALNCGSATLRDGKSRLLRNEHPNGFHLIAVTETSLGNRLVRGAKFSLIHRRAAQQSIYTESRITEYLYFCILELRDVFALT